MRELLRTQLLTSSCTGWQNISVVRDILIINSASLTQHTNVSTHSKSLLCGATFKVSCDDSRDKLVELECVGVHRTQDGRHLSG